MKIQFEFIDGWFVLIVSDPISIGSRINFSTVFVKMATFLFFIFWDKEERFG